jgi:hypothetical protein
LLTVETPGDSIAEEYDVVRFLTEKQVKRGNYIWMFRNRAIGTACLMLVR